MVTARPNPRAAQLQPPPNPRARTRRGVAGRNLTPEQYRQNEGVDPIAEAVGAKLEHCDRHAVDYYVFERQKNVCPACKAEDKVTGLEIEVTQLRNGMEKLTEENQRLTKVANMIAAMRDAVDLMDLEDLMWIKAVVYRWRADRSVKLKHCQVGPDGYPMGIMAMPKSGDPEARECSSIGGIALAGFIEQMNQSHGPEDTMSTLARAMHRHLKGGLG